MLLDSVSLYNSNKLAIRPLDYCIPLCRMLVSIFSVRVMQIARRRTPL